MGIKFKKDIQQRRITVGDIGISYLIKEGESAQPSKNAPPLTVLFLHGFPFNKKMWMAQLKALPPGMTGIALDVRGHGQSTMGHGFFSVDLFAHDVIEFMRKLKIEKAVICGVSMGGYIALRAHEIVPDKFSGLILSDTNSISDSDEGKLKRFETIKTVLKSGTRSFSLIFTPKVFSKHSLDHKKEEVELIKDSIRRNNVRTICATLLALASRTDTTYHLKNIKIPVLLIWGKEDELTPKQQGLDLLEKLPNARFVELEKCGHLPSLEDSERFNKEMHTFLQAITP